MGFRFLLDLELLPGILIRKILQSLFFLETKNIFGLERPDSGF
jgi:hypothetical protein